MHGGLARNIFVNVLLTYSKQCKQAVNKHVDITVSMAEVEPETKICEPFYKNRNFKIYKGKIMATTFQMAAKYSRWISPGWLRLTA